MFFTLISDDVNHPVDATRLSARLYKETQGEHGFQGSTELVYADCKGMSPLYCFLPSTIHLISKFLANSMLLVVVSAAYSIYIGWSRCVQLQSTALGPYAFTPTRISHTM